MVPHWVILSAVHTAHPKAARLAAAAPGNWTTPGGSEISSPCEICTRSTDGSDALPSSPGCLSQAEVSSEVRSPRLTEAITSSKEVASSRHETVHCDAFRACFSGRTRATKILNPGEGYVLFQQAVSYRFTSSWDRANPPRPLQHRPHVGKPIAASMLEETRLASTVVRDQLFSRVDAPSYETRERSTSRK